MKNRLLATVSLSTLAMIGTAYAADMPVKAPPAPSPQPVNWTGIYLGLNGGFASGRIRTTALDAVGDFGAGSVTGTGGIGGGQIGANWQWQNFVLGVEADLDATHLRGSTNSFAVVGPIPGTGPFSGETTSLATVRGRAGILVSPAVLLYGTGGFAAGHINDQEPILDGGFATSGTRSGWTAGGGVEWMIAPHWSVKAEGLYVNLGTATVGNALGAGYVGTFQNTAAIGRVGVNYKF